jgi:hypothetical protein
MGLAFADVFDFRRMQGIDLRPALTLLLLAYAATCRRCGAGENFRNVAHGQSFCPRSAGNGDHDALEWVITMAWNQ